MARLNNPVELSGIMKFLVSEEETDLFVVNKKVFHISLLSYPMLFVVLDCIQPVLYTWVAGIGFFQYKISRLMQLNPKLIYQLSMDLVDFKQYLHSVRNSISFV